MSDALRFLVGMQTFAVPDAAEVVGLEGFTPLPGAPPHLPGVCVVRGEVIPLVDLSALTGNGPHPTKRAVVVRTDKGALAFYADAVKGLEPLEGKQAPLATSGAKRFVSEIQGVLAIDPVGLLGHFSR